jgi:hypothetical protein
MKAEIEKILEEFLLSRKKIMTGIDTFEIKYDYAQATSSITALIIKWLEGKKAQQCLVSGKYEQQKMYARNQLITELIGEVR